MTLVEALGEGFKVTAVGLVIVFAVLIILMLVMMLMKVVFYKDPSKTAEEVAEPVKTSTPANDNIDETELIAVLTAAIAASLNTSTYNLNIKSYRRIENTSPAWNKAGLRDVIDSRF